MQTKGKSKQSRTRRDKDSSMSNPTLMVQLELPLFAIAESVQLNSEAILSGKLPTCNPSIQKQKLSETSAQASTSSKKDCAPYWTDLAREISSRLLLPTVTGSQGEARRVPPGGDLQAVSAGLDSSFFSTWSSKTVDSSWFSTQLYTAPNENSPKIFSPFSTSSLVECMDLESTVKRSRKIRISFCSQQRQTLKQWFGVSRFVYNATIKLLQDSSIKGSSALSMLN